MFTEKTLATKVHFSGNVFTAEVQTVQLHDGSRSTREIVRHNGGAAVVAIDPQRRIVLVRQYRKAVEQLLLEIPAGKLEPGEDPTDCARRELREETGYTAGVFTPLARIYPSPGYCSETLHLFYADELVSGSPRPDEGEYVETVRMPIETCLREIEEGRIQDAKTISGILLAIRKAEHIGDTV